MRTFKRILGLLGRCFITAVFIFLLGYVAFDMYWLGVTDTMRYVAEQGASK